MGLVGFGPADPPPCTFDYLLFRSLVSEAIFVNGDGGVLLAVVRGAPPPPPPHWSGTGDDCYNPT